jgi:hypothetical protein
MGQITSVLGAVAPALGAVTQAVSAAEQVGSLFGASSLSSQRSEENSLRQRQQQALRQLEQSQSEQLRDQQEQATLDRAKITNDAVADEERRKAALRRAVARQRTQFSSQGLSGVGGSAEAVLLGLFEESDSEREQRERIDSVRTSALDQDVAARKRLNVLQRNQLIEQQRLQRAVSGF